MGHNIVRGFLSIFTSRLLGTALGIIITPVLVRVLGSSQYGTYVFLMSLLSMTMVVVNSGLFDGIRKYSAENRSTSNWHESIFQLFISVGFILSFTSFLLMILLAELGLIDRIFNINKKIYVYMIGTILISRQLSIITRGMLHGLNLEHFAEPLKVGKQVIFAFIGLSLALLGYGITGVLIGEVAGGIITLVIGIGILSRHIDIRKLFEPLSSNLPIKGILGFNLTSSILNGLFMSLYHVDILVLKYFLPSQQVGYYKGALVIAEFLWFGSLALQVVLLQSTSTLWIKQDYAKISNIASRVTKYNILLITLLVLGLGILADSFIPLYYGEEFTKSILPLMILLPGVFGYAIAKPIIAIGQSKGDLKILIIATSASALINLLLNIILIPRFGIIGAAVGTSVGYVSMLVFNGAASFKINFNPFQNLQIIRIIITTIISGLLLISLDFVISSDIYSLLVIPPIGLITHLSISIRFGLIDQEILSQIIDHIPDPLANYIRKLVEYL